MCSVINGGSYYQPHLVSEIKDSSGSTVKKFDPIFMKQTVSSEISADIRSYMQASVQEGTSGTSKVQGYSSGGKTGTAEKLPRGNGKYLVSFITFAPVDDPQIFRDLFPCLAALRNQVESHLKYMEHPVIDRAAHLDALGARLFRCRPRII